VISGLRVGADDYLTKDVSLPHLTARINTLFRRIDAIRRPQARRRAAARPLKLAAERMRVTGTTSRCRSP
jgi:two-component system OmpR family response regulator